RLTFGARISLCSRLFFSDTWMSRSMSSTYYVDCPQHFGGGSHSGFDQPGCLVLHGPHALMAGRLANVFTGTALQHQVADRVGDRQQLEHPDPVQVSGMRAEVAARAAHEPVRRDPATDGIQKGQLL